MSDPRLTPLKVEYGGEIHRIRVDLTSFKFSQLQTVFQESFSIEQGSYAVKYTDNEGDSVKVTSEEEFVEACKVFMSYANDVQSIRFTAVSIPMMKFQDAAEPLMKALAALLNTLDVVKGKVEKEDWIGQCKRGLSITGEAITQAADDVRESFIFCKQKIKEYEMQGRINEAVNELGAATQKLVDSVQASIKSLEKNRGEAQFANNTDMDQNNEETVNAVVDEQSPVMVSIPCENPDTTHIEEATQSEKATEPEVVNSVAQDIEFIQSSEKDWDVVSSEEEMYASELLIIKEIFPSAETSIIISLLERYNRNIQITLNALAEM